MSNNQINTSEEIKYNKYHPIVINGLLVGGSENELWLNVDNITPYISGSEKYSAVGREYNIATCILGQVERDEITGAEYISTKDKISLEGPIIYYGGVWNAIPRIPYRLSNQAHVYKNIIKELLLKKGLPIAEPVINSIFKVDIEGDNVDEVIIEASYFKNGIMGISREGNYSIIYLRKIIDNEVKNIEIISAVYLEDNDTRLEFKNEIVSILDLNGDGKMEIVIKSQYYEGYGYSIYEINDSEINCVLNNVDGV